MSSLILDYSYLHCLTYLVTTRTYYWNIIRTLDGQGGYRSLWYDNLKTGLLHFLNVRNALTGAQHQA